MEAEIKAVNQYDISTLIAVFESGGSLDDGELAALYLHLKAAYGLLFPLGAIHHLSWARIGSDMRTLQGYIRARQEKGRLRDIDLQA